MRPEFNHWTKTVEVDLRLQGKVVEGFQRGSKQLGCPTANLEMTSHNIALTDQAVPGVYMGTCELNGSIFKTAISVGWNPCYDNLNKTVEAYLLGASYSRFGFFGESIQTVNNRSRREEKLLIDELYEYMLIWGNQSESDFTNESIYYACEFLIHSWWSEGFEIGEKRYKLRLH